MANNGYYSNKIIYTITNGYPGFTVELLNSDKPNNTHADFGTYEFTEVDYGFYYLRITDGKGCMFETQINIVDNHMPSPGNLGGEDDYALDYDDAIFTDFEDGKFTIYTNNI